MRAYALADIGEREAIDVYLRRDDAFGVLEEVLRDEPDWWTLHVVPIELDEREFSLN